MRLVFWYVPEYERRWNRRAKRWARPGGWMRLTFGPGRGWATSTARSISREERWSRYSRSAAESLRRWPFFCKAVAACAPRWPRKITLDGHKQSHWALRRLRRDSGGHRIRATDPRAAVKVRTRPVDLLVAEDAMGYGLVVSLSVPIPRQLSRDPVMHQNLPAGPFPKSSQVTMRVLAP